MSEPRQYTQEECQKLFLKGIATICNFWSNSETPKDIIESQGLDTEAKRTKWKVEGAAFSILVLLDGGNAAIPGFELYPAPHLEDQSYRKECGENWWPGPPKRCLTKDNEDIPSVHGGVQLHDIWGKVVKAHTQDRVEELL